jgi:hypothetical protein
VRPAHPVGAVGDQRVEPRGHDSAEPFVGAVGASDPAEVDGLDNTVDDYIGCGLGILCRDAEFARMIVTCPGRDDAERNVGLRQHLQRKRDDAVPADDHQRVHPTFECAFHQSPRVVGVSARDRDDVDAALVQLRDGTLCRVRRAPVPRRGIGQDGDSHGISLPGFMIPVGSSVALTARNTSTPRSPTSSRIHGR